MVLLDLFNQSWIIKLQNDNFIPKKVIYISIKANVNQSQNKEKNKLQKY